MFFEFYILYFFFVFCFFMTTIFGTREGRLPVYKRHPRSQACPEDNSPSQECFCILYCFLLFLNVYTQDKNDTTKPTVQTTIIETLVYRTRPLVRGGAQST